MPRNRKKYLPTSVGLPRETIDLLDDVASRRGLSRNKVIIHYLTLGMKAESVMRPRPSDAR